jgi:membrane-associated phospholipid phosphatase
MNNNQIVVFFSSILFLNILVKLLKNLIKESRPISTKTFGMPSSKSTIITFMLIYLISIHNYTNQTLIIIFVLSILIIYIKHLYKEHSFLQLLVGVIIGFIFAKIIIYLTN